MDSRSATPYRTALQDYEVGLDAVIAATTARRNCGGDGATIRGLRQELEEARRKLLLQEAELKGLKEQVKELKQAKDDAVIAVEVVKDRAKQLMKERLDEVKKLEGEEKAQLREQLQTAKDYAEELSKKMSEMEGALDLKMTEVENLVGEVQSLMDHQEKDDLSRKSLILTKDRENDKLVSELKRKDKKIQKLSKEMEALKKVHEEEFKALTEELAQERLSAQRYRIELGQKLLNSNVKDIMTIGTELTTQLINMKEEEEDEEVANRSGDPGTQDEVEDEASHSNSESMDMTEPESEEEVAPSHTARKGYSLRRNRAKRSYAEMTDSDPHYETDEEADPECEVVTWKGRTSGSTKEIPQSWISDLDGKEHGSGRRLRCLCGKKFGSAVKLKRHFQYYLVNSVDLPSCDVCGTGPMTATTMGQHLRSKTHERKVELAKRQKNDDTNPGDDLLDVDDEEEEMEAEDLEGMPQLTPQAQGEDTCGRGDGIIM